MKMHLGENSTTQANNITRMPTNFDELVEISLLFEEVESVIRIIVPLMFGIIAVTGFFGNSLVILVVVFNQQMHSTTNLLIASLAIADLLFVVFCIPFTATDYVLTNWPFGDFWCSSVQYLIVVTTLASIYTLVLMSIDRFLAVVHPIRSRMLRTEHYTKIAICTLWTIVLSICIPVFLTHGVLYDIEPAKNTTLIMCQYTGAQFFSYTAYQATFFITTYLLPLIIISFLYVRMIMRLWGTGVVKMSIESERGRKRVTRLVVVVVIAFASLWLPVQLILVLKSLNMYPLTSKFKIIMQVVAQTLAYSSSCINPLLYAFLSENFRKAFRKAIQCSQQYQNYTTDLPPPRRTSCAKTSTTGM